MPLQYQQQKEWSNGITDDRFLGRGYCGDAEGVNLRRQSRGVFLSNNTRETGIYDTSFMGAGSAYRQYGMGRFKSGGANDILYALYDGGAIDTTTGTFFTYAGAFAGGRNITKVVSAGVNYGVLARSQGTNGVRRWNDDSSSIGTAAATVSLSNNTSDYRPILVSGGFMYVGGNGTVDAIDISTSTWFLYKTVTIPGQCRGITEIGDQIFIYSEDGVNGYKMSWDGVSKYPLYIQKWADNPVLNVANMGNYDYVITGTGEFNTLKYRRLFLSSGFEKTLITGSDYLENDKQLFFFSPIHTNAIEVENNTIYFAGRHCTYSYGTSKASLKPSLSKDIVISDCEQITAMYLQRGAYMYVAYYDAAGVNHIIKQDVRPGRAYGTTGFVHTLAFDGGDIETEKNNNRIIVNYRLGSKTTAPTGTTSIDIYTRVNGDEERVFDCSAPTSNPVKGDIYTYGGCTYTVKEFTAHNELVCSRNENGPQYNNITRNSGTLTKTYGVGDASLTFSNVDNFVFLASITDTTKRKAKIPFTKKWYDLEIRAVLNSTQQSITPELYSIKTLFDFIDLDNG